MRGFLAAVALLTRFPVPGASSVSGAAWFPLVGAVVGAAGAGVYWMAGLALPPLLSALAAMTGIILLTGALHEDGLADYADALGSRARGEKALQIMDDPRVGTFGALALIVALVWRVFAVSALEPAEALAGLVMAHALARSGTAVLSGVLRPARSTGMAGAMASSTRPTATLVAAAGGIAVALLVAGGWAIPALLLAGAIVLAVRRSALRLVGGVTGDVLGACEQITEVALLTLAVAAAGVSSPVWEGLL